MDETHHMVNPRLMGLRNGMPFRVVGIRNKFQQLCMWRIVSKKHSRKDGYTQLHRFWAGYLWNGLL